jgi:hypothetical protein
MLLILNKGKEMKNRKILFIASTVLVVIMAGVIVYAQDWVRPHPDDYVFNEIVLIKGHVTILNHPELGRTVGSGMYLVFQREGCKKCLIATSTDLDGNYQILVGRGRYKVISRDARGGGAPSYDMLAPNQTRYINAQNKVSGERFDINVVIPKR